LRSVIVKANCSWGRLKMQNGNVYEGGWVNNKMQGKGKIIYYDHGDTGTFYGLGAYYSYTGE